MLRFDDYRCVNNNTNQDELLGGSEKRKIFNITNSIAWEFYKSNSTFTFDEIQSTAYMGHMHICNANCSFIFSWKYYFNYSNHKRS